MKDFLHDKSPTVFFLSFLSLLVFDCASQRNQPVRDIEIVERTELPIFQSEIEAENITLSVVFEITEDGSIKNVQLLTSSGDREWDSTAVDSLKKWKFVAPPSGSVLVVRKNITVELLQSEIMNLGKLIASNADEANVLHFRLRAGISFEQLVRQSSGDSSLGKGGDFLQDVNTADMPARISKILIDLNVGEYSRPVMLDGEYVIFKRYGDQLPTNKSNH